MNYFFSNNRNAVHLDSFWEVGVKLLVSGVTKDCSRPGTGAVLSNPNTKKNPATTNVITGILVGVLL